MIANFPDALKRALLHEGGYVNNSKDPGGMTNLGVTKRVWEAYTGGPVTETDMRALTPIIVSPLYKKSYWDKIRGDDLPSGLDEAAFDLAINSGVGRASKFLQRIAGVPEDGMVGYKTLTAIAQHDPKDMVNELCDMRLEFLRALPTFATFGKGWERRVEEVRATALRLV